MSRTGIPPAAERIGLEVATTDGNVRLKADTASYRSLVRSVRLQPDDVSPQTDDVRAERRDSSADPVAMTPTTTEPTPVLYPTRVFAGRYERAENSPAVKKESNGSFDGVVAAGLGIGEAAQKAGLGLSGAFTRAGTGLARRF